MSSHSTLVSINSKTPHKAITKIKTEAGLIFEIKVPNFRVDLKLPFEKAILSG